MAEIPNTSLTYAFKNVPDGQDLCSEVNWSFPVNFLLSIKERTWLKLENCSRQNFLPASDIWKVLDSIRLLLPNRISENVRI